MIWVDYAILAIVVLSAIWGLFRGLIQETFSLVSWIAALWIGFRYFRVLAPNLESWLADDSLGAGAAFVLLFLSTLVVGKICGYLLASLIDQTRMRGFNRLGGLLFGGLRGLVLVMMIVYLARTSILASEPWWKESSFLPLLNHWSQKLARVDSGGLLSAVNSS